MSNRKIILIRNAASQDFGGGERFPVFLAEVLKSGGYCPVVVSRSKKLLSFAKKNNIQTIRGWWWHKQHWSGKHIFFIPLYIAWQLCLFFYYMILFKNLRPIAVHIQSKDDFIAGTYAAKLLHIRIVWTDHADLKHIFQNVTVWYKNPIGKIILHTAGLADAITVVSKSELNLITQHLPKRSLIRSKLKVIYNGVIDLSIDYPRQVSKGVNFLVASRLVKDKGIQEVIDAFSDLHKRYPGSTLNIIGDGPDAEFFKKQKHDSINFLGHQQQPLVFMASSTIFVHPTYHEGFSVALVEASMMSLPIITTSVGGNVEIIANHKTGVLVPPRDTTSLLKAMELLIKKPALRNKIAKNARQQYINSFQFDSIVNENFIPLYTGNL